MIRVLGCIFHEHNLSLVALAAILCVFSCAAAMIMVGRARLLEGSARFVWISCAGALGGFGIWATHFVAMLAYNTNFPIAFDPAFTLLSILIAASMCGFGFAISLERVGPILGGAVTGLAIAAMHYVGMAAVRAPADQIWNLRYVTTSVIVSVVLMAGGMWVVVRRNSRASLIASTVIFTLAICGMHFTGMTALTLSPNPTVAVPEIVMDPATLAVAIAAVSFLVIGLSLVGVLFEKQRANFRELEITKTRLEQLSNGLKIALEEAQSANRAKASFFAAMSHEFRTPLNAIIGFSAMLEAEVIAPLGHPRIAEYVHDIHESGLRLLNIISDVLDMSRMDAGKMPLRECEVDLDDLITKTLRVVETQAEKADVHLSKELRDDLPEIVGDSDRLEQILLNLLSNAIKFTPKGGDIKVSANQDADGLHIAVSDSGIGIAEDQITEILKPFFQVDHTLARKYEGAGLGLPIAKGLVELHGGTLSVKAQLHVGTTITVTLPLSRIIESGRGKNAYPPRERLA